MTSAHPFDIATELQPDGADRFIGETSSDYANMVGPFGGITAAVLIRAIEKHPDRLGEPVSLTVNFASPIADGPFAVCTQLVRTNRSNQHWIITLQQGDAVTTSATAVFAIRRPSWTATEASAPDAPPADTLARQEFPDFITWTRNYDMRFAEGGPSTIAAGTPAGSAATVWVRDLPARPLDHPALTALTDIFFPRIMMRLGKFVPAGTTSLTVHYHASATQLTEHGSGYVLATARANHFGHGYFDQTTRLWGLGGTLLATSSQMVYYKEPPSP